MIRYILFDLDNTLYPASAGMEEEMMARIIAYSAAYLGVSTEEALRLRREQIADYGTTLEWLMAEHGLTAIEEYYAFVHPDGEEERLTPDPQLRAFIQALPVPASILTNAPMEHAERVLRKLELEGLFQHIFDIRSNGLKGKPNEIAFRNALKVIGHKPEEVLFVDDLPPYIEGFLRLGGNGVLVDHGAIYPSSTIPRVRTVMEIGRFLN